MVNKSIDRREVVNTLTEKGVSGISLVAAYPISNEHYDKTRHYTTCRNERNCCQWRVLRSFLLQNFTKFCKKTLTVGPHELRPPRQKMETNFESSQSQVQI